MVAFNLTPQNKSQLTLLIKNRFFESPSVLSIGDGFNDLLMFQQSDVSIEIIHECQHCKRHEIEIEPDFEL